MIFPEIPDFFFMILVPPDALDIFFVVALSILLLVIYLSSAYDERLRIKNYRSTKIQMDPVQHYRKEPQVLGMQNENVLVNLKITTGPAHMLFSLMFLSAVQKFLVAFSFRRNWNLLSAPVKADMRDLRSISAVRIWTMIAIFYGHCSWFCVAIPIANPIYVEKVSVDRSFTVKIIQIQLFSELPPALLHAGD